MKLIKEIISNNWIGDGIFPEWWDLSMYHKLWLAPVLLIQTLFAIPAFIVREHREEKKRYLRHTKD